MTDRIEEVATYTEVQRRADRERLDRQFREGRRIVDELRVWLQARNIEISGLDTQCFVLTFTDSTGERVNFETNTL